MFSLNDVDLIIGIDQTGALKSSKNPTPKPLPLYSLNLSNNSFLDFSKNHYLSELSIFGIEKFVQEAYGVGLKSFRAIIAVDAVLGLPKESVSSRSYEPLLVFRECLSWAQKTEGWGQKVAEKFYKQNFNSKDQLYRKVDTKLGASSLFQSRPFQRNVQTGSFRIWKDLVQSDYKKYQLWPFQQTKIKKGIPLICEAYPSLAWKLLNESKRTHQKYDALLKKLPKKFKKRVEALALLSPDHKDAAMLSFFIFWLLKEKEFKFEGSSVDIEGGVIGSHLV